MAKMSIEKNYRIHVLDITDIVHYYESKIEHLVDSYILSHNAVNLLFDYCIHKAMAIILNIKLNLNGNAITSDYLDHDLFDDTFGSQLGEVFINSLYTKLVDHNLLIQNTNPHLGYHNHGILKPNISNIKLVAVGNALWIFEGMTPNA